MRKSAASSLEEVVVGARRGRPQERLLDVASNLCLAGTHALQEERVCVLKTNRQQSASSHLTHPQFPIPSHPPDIFFLNLQLLSIGGNANYELKTKLVHAPACRRHGLLQRG